MSKPKPATGKRDNTYYLDRLEREAPAIFADWKAGRIASPAEAFRKAGLKRPRTRLQELKNAWTKATPADRKAFSRWLRTTLPAPAKAITVSSSPALAVEGQLTPEAKCKIATILSSRKIGTGIAMKEMGFGALDPSLGSALRRGTHIRPELVHQLERWVAANAEHGN